MLIDVKNPVVTCHHKNRRGIRGDPNIAIVDSPFNSFAPVQQSPANCEAAACVPAVLKRWRRDPQPAKHFVDHLDAVDGAVATAKPIRATD